MQMLRRYGQRIKPYLSPLVLFAIFIFLGQALFSHWEEVRSINISGRGWAFLAIATGVTLLAHIWTGWVWGWILQELGQTISRTWATQTYLKTNIAKYLPGNVFHLYGRTRLAHQAGVPLPTGSVSIVLDTLLMLAAGLIVGLFVIPQGGLWLAIATLLVILIVLHPRTLGRALALLGRWLPSAPESDRSSKPPKHYPLGPFLGEFLFVILRGFGFVLTLAALTPLDISSAPILVSISSIGWALGFATPGAPGGLGIYELTVSTLLGQADLFPNGSGFSVGLAISAVAMHRVVSTLAEAIGAILVWADERWPL